jgi:altronate dehydratase large subunit
MRIGAADPALEEWLSTGGSITFAGYRRGDGRYGVRNRVLVLGLNGLVARAAARIADGVSGTVLFASHYGRGQFGDDRRAHTAQLIGLGRNPNIAATLVVGADRQVTDEVAHAIEAAGKPVAAIALDDVHEDALELSVRGIRLAAALAREASRQQRERVPLAGLFLAVECGHSDATSGLVSIASSMRAARPSSVKRSNGSAPSISLPGGPRRRT